MAVLLLLVMLSALPSRTNNNGGREEEEGGSRIPFVWRPYRNQYAAAPRSPCFLVFVSISVALRIVDFGRAWAGYGCRKCFESAVKREIRRSFNSWMNTSVVLFKCNQNSSCFVGSASSYVQFELSHNGSHDTRL